MQTGKKERPQNKNLQGPRWKKGESGNPKGRPRKYVTEMKLQGYKLSEINDCIVILIRLREDELKQITRSQAHPVLEKNIALAILADMKVGRIVTIETILSRVFGRPKNEITATIKATENVKLMLPDNEKTDEIEDIPFEEVKQKQIAK